MDLKSARFRRGHELEETTSLMVYETTMWRMLDLLGFRVEQDKSSL